MSSPPRTPTAAQGIPEPSTLIDSALGQENTTSDGQIAELLPGAAWPCPAGQINAAWPTSASAVPQSATTSLIVIYFMVNCAIIGTSYSAPQAMGVATYWYDDAQVGGPIRATVVNNAIFPLMNRGGAGKVAGLGGSSVFDAADNNIYVYGCSYDNNGTPSCIIGRAFAGSVGTGSAYTYWNGSTWVFNRNAAAVVAMGGTISVNQSVQWVPQMNRYVVMNNAYSSTNFEFRTAINPWGPWSNPSSAFVTDCGSVVCRTVAIHAELSDSHHLAISYVPQGVEGPKLASVGLFVEPIGNFESISATGGTITINGWVLDPDIGDQVTIAPYIDGVPAGQYFAGNFRNDVNTLYPWYGGNHGYNQVLYAGPGPHTVCVYALNLLIGAANPFFGCKTVTVAITVPIAPTLPAVVGGDTQVLATWAIPSDIGGVDPATMAYHVTVSPSIAGSPFTITSGGRSLLVNGLNNATTYSFAVTATNAAGTSPASPAAIATPQAIPGVTFHPISPVRAVDSRIGTGWYGPIGWYGSGVLTVAGLSGIPASATSIVMNITVTGSSANSFLTAYPTGQAVPNVSNLNFAAGQTIANLATVKVGAGGNITFATANGNTDVVADIVGWYDDASISGDLFNSLNPKRAVDSRIGSGWTGKLVSAAPRDLQVTGLNTIPVTATAVVMNVTATGSDANSFITVYPAGQPKPNASNVNFAAGETIANLATVKIGAGGMVTFATQLGSTHVVADVVGWYEPGAGNRFHTVLAPTRILDDRFGTGGFTTPVASSAARSVNVGGVGGVAANAVAVVANTTVVNSTANSFLTLYPTGQLTPNASNLNFAKGQVIPNLAVAKLGTAGKIDITTAAGTVTVILDVSGYFSAT